MIVLNLSHGVELNVQCKKGLCDGKYRPAHALLYLPIFASRKVYGFYGVWAEKGVGHKKHDAEMAGACEKILLA